MGAVRSLTIPKRLRPAQSAKILKFAMGGATVYQSTTMGNLSPTLRRSG
jgi:hypothetical protein